MYKIKSYAMLRNLLFGIIVLVGCGAGTLHLVSANSSRQQPLQSFFIARFFFSDYIPGWSQSILDVSPEGDGVRVRLIRISQANDYCPGVIVRAAERVLPRTSVTEVAGINMCAFTSRRLDAALKKAPASGDPSDSATETLVASCGTHQREFDFPYPTAVDQERLSQSNPKVSNLWDTYRRIYEQTFGESFSFTKFTPGEEKQMTELGTKVLPDLKSGKYQRAYEGSKCGEGHRCANYLAWRLQGYTEAPQPYDPATVTLLDASALSLIKYVPPVVPRLAMLARIYGDVRMRIHVEPQTGLVRNVEVLSGNPILSDPSIAAARSWQFAPESLSDSIVEATLQFQLQCH